MLRLLREQQKRLSPGDSAQLFSGETETHGATVAFAAVAAPDQPQLPIHVMLPPCGRQTEDGAIDARDHDSFLEDKAFEKSSTIKPGLFKVGIFKVLFLLKPGHQ